MNGNFSDGRVVWLKCAVLGFYMVADRWFGEFDARVALGCVHSVCVMELWGVMTLVELHSVFKMCDGGFIYPCSDWYMGCWCVLFCVLMTYCKSGDSSIDNGVVVVVV